MVLGPVPSPPTVTDPGLGPTHLRPDWQACTTGKVRSVSGLLPYTWSGPPPETLLWTDQTPPSTPTHISPTVWFSRPDVTYSTGLRDTSLFDALTLPWPSHPPPPLRDTRALGALHSLRTPTLRLVPERAPVPGLTGGREQGPLTNTSLDLLLAPGKSGGGRGRRRDSLPHPLFLTLHPSSDLHPPQMTQKNRREPILPPPTKHPYLCTTPNGPNIIHDRRRKHRDRSRRPHVPCRPDWPPRYPGPVPSPPPTCMGYRDR